MATTPSYRHESLVEFPMRDGVILRGNVFRPTAGDGPDAPRPVLLERTPYSAQVQPPAAFIDAGYTVVTQDTRGRYSSDGHWIPFTEHDTLDGQDGYDTIEWIANQPWCNGKVGTYSASYNSWVQWQAARLQPPHLVAMAAISIPQKLTDLDYPGGFRLARRFHWWITHMTPNARKRDGLSPPHKPEDAKAIWTHIEHAQRLSVLPVSKVIDWVAPSMQPYVESWLKEPHREPWQFEQHYKDIAVPNLDMSGWFDHAFGNHIAGLQRDGATPETREQSRSYLGPWNHATIGGHTVNGFSFGQQAVVDRYQLFTQWFDYWLKAQGAGLTDKPPVQYFMMGSNDWRAADTWPPASATSLTLHLAADQQLTEQPDAEPSADHYPYDPADPVPTLWQTDLNPTANDRSQLDYRNDILRYRTAPLDEAIEIAGHPTVTLAVESSAPDTDFFAHLVDEAPDGTAMELCFGMVSLRHRNGLDRREMLPPHTRETITIKLGPTANHFKPGHRIRLDISSSNFPHFARNLNIDGDSLFETRMQTAEQTVHLGGDTSSAMTLPLVVTG